MGLFNLLKPAKTVLVVDIVSINESMGTKGKTPPRNQLQILRRLARFAQREKMELIAVLSGAPLNKAPAGKTFEEIKVVYSKSLEQHSKFMVKTARAQGAGAVLVTSNAAAEKIAGSSVKKMRVSTFRKAFDLGGDNEGSERGENSRGRSNRPPRRRPQKQSNKGGNSTNSNEPKKERPPKQATESDAINELIDLVD